MNGIEIAEFLAEERAQRTQRAALAREVKGRMVPVLQRDMSGEPAELAQLFWTRAQEFTEEAQRDQRFVVVSYGEDGSVHGQRLFRIAAGASLVGVGAAEDDDEPRRQKTDREYQHVEVRDRLNLRREEELWKNVRVQNSQMAEELRQLREENRKLLGSRKEEVAAIEQLKSEAHARELQQIDATQTARMKAGVYLGAMNLLPVIVAHLTGSTALARFLEQIDPEVVDAFLEALTPQQLVSFKRLMVAQKKAADSRGKLAEASDGGGSGDAG